MKPFIKEVLYDGAILLGLVVLPLAFIGPNGFASKLGHSKDTTYGGQSQPGNGEATSPDERKQSEPDRFIPILHAFRRPGEEPPTNGNKS